MQPACFRAMGVQGTREAIVNEIGVVLTGGGPATRWRAPGLDAWQIDPFRLSRAIVDAGLAACAAGSASASLPSRASGRPVAWWRSVRRSSPNSSAPRRTTSSQREAALEHPLNLRGGQEGHESIPAHDLLLDQ